LAQGSRHRKAVAVQGAARDHRDSVTSILDAMMRLLGFTCCASNSDEGGVAIIDTLLDEQQPAKELFILEQVFDAPMDAEEKAMQLLDEARLAKSEAQARVKQLQEEAALEKAAAAERARRAADERARKLQHEVALERGSTAELAEREAEERARQPLEQAALEKAAAAEQAATLPHLLIKQQVFDAPKAGTLPELAAEPATQEETPEPVREFKVSVRKGPGESANLALDTCAGVIEVCCIGDGPVQEYNDGADYHHQVKVGDFIVGVNGMFGQPDKLLKEFRSDELELVVRHPTIVVLQLRKHKGTFGLDLTHAAGSVAKSLAVFSVIEGPVVDWNKTQTDVQVKKGDRIVAVNGMTGTPEELLKMLQASEEEAEVQICCVGL